MKISNKNFANKINANYTIISQGGSKVENRLGYSFEFCKQRFHVCIYRKAIHLQHLPTTGHMPSLVTSLIPSLPDLFTTRGKKIGETGDEANW